MRWSLAVGVTLWRTMPLFAALVIGTLTSTDVALADIGPWNAPVKVSGETSHAWWPDVAADDFGNVHVVWNATFPDRPTFSGAGTDEIRAPASPVEGSSVIPGRDVGALFYVGWDGRDWTRVNDIALIWRGHALRSSIATDAFGRLHLVYKGMGELNPTALDQKSRPLGPEELWYKSSKGNRVGAIASWTAPRQVTRGSQGYFSDLAVDSRGVIHAIWTESSQPGWGIYYRSSVDGGVTWTDPVALDGGNFVWWYRTQLKIDAQDRLHVVWEVTDQEHLDETRGAIYARSVDGGKSWSRTSMPEDLRPYPAYADAGPGPSQPAVGIDGKGTILFVYRDPTSAQISYRQSDDGVHWSVPASIPGVKEGVARPYDMYDMVTDGAGHVVLAMVGYPSGSDVMGLLVSEWDGQGWGMPSVVVSSPPFPEYPRLAVSQGNTLHLVWFQGDRATVDRLPLGIWYSTARTSASALPPRTAPSAVEATDLTQSKPVSSSAVAGPILSQPSGASRLSATGADGSVGLLDPPPSRGQAFPLVAGVGSAISFIVLTVLMRLGFSAIQSRRS